MLIYFIVFQEAAVLSAIGSNLFENFLYKIEATKQKKINRMHWLVNFQFGFQYTNNTLTPITYNCKYTTLRACPTWNKLPNLHFV